MKKFFAFTLAETLITLTVVGVLASIIIPTVSKQFYKRSLEVKLERTYAELKDAIRRSELDNGNLKYWNFASNAGARDFVEKYLMPYIAKENYSYCTSKCFKGKNWPLDKDGKTYSPCCTSKIRYKYDDKSLFIQPVVDDGGCAYNFPGICTTPKLARIFIDIDGDKGPSVLGVDVHMFILVSYTKKTGWGGGPTGEYYGLYTGSEGSGYYASYKYDDEEVKKRCTEYTDSGSLRFPGDCTLLLQRNNWKFPKDYPIKF